jgi:hypothetical protein
VTVLAHFIAVQGTTIQEHLSLALELRESGDGRNQHHRMW